MVSKGTFLLSEYWFIAASQKLKLKYKIQQFIKYNNVKKMSKPGPPRNSRRHEIPKTIKPTKKYVSQLNQ